MELKLYVDKEKNPQPKIPEGDPIELFAELNVVRIFSKVASFTITYFRIDEWIYAGLFFYRKKN